ncbi:MAG: gliding motility-associated C-terminal domain-containing protein [Chitinophagaceae bacterium]|nr:gliding motility-associated C-terminal domain-containing protein [Chitinophagaceae bacterium]MCA6477120.1 gliding motility-associated C-terminal domain-containing protein [Chitinophagaceae bacterium]MCA6496621.1 gliding motility-associated C-terminal domain-containing protein [Chitinophagaceae bacterium]
MLSIGLYRFLRYLLWLCLIFISKEKVAAQHLVVPPSLFISDSIVNKDSAVNRGVVIHHSANIDHLSLSTSRQIGVESTNVLALFEMPDSACVNSSVTITNRSTNATSYRWDFCAANIDQVPTGVLLGNPGNSLGIPVFSDYAFDNGNYYAFVVNNTPGGLIRLNFGNSLLNTPIVTNLGNFNGSIPNSAQGLQVLKANGSWYAFVVGGDPLIGISSRIVKLDFGTSLNNTPIHTNWGNIGNMDYPVDLFIFQEDNNWYGLTVNYRNSTITKFSFGLNFTGIPTGENLGNIGNLDLPSGICPINDNGVWRVFVSNFGNSTLSRLDFGSSMLLTPTGTNLGNIGNSLSSPRDLFIMKYCDKLVGFLVNGGPGDLVRLTFTTLGTNPLAQSLGRIGGASSPHSISKIFRDGADLYAFMPNASGNTLSRIKFTGCVSSNISSSNAVDPPPIIYGNPGVYNVSLVVDEGLPTQSSFCKQIVVRSPANLNLTRNYVVCQNYDSILLTVSNVKFIEWTPSIGLSSSTSSSPKAAPNESVRYRINGLDINNCSINDSIQFTVNPSISIQVLADTAICSGQKLLLTQTSPAGLSYQWTPSIGLNDPSLPEPLATPFTTTSYYVTASSAFGCLAKDTVSIVVHPPIQFDLNLSKTEICKGDSILVTGSGADAYAWLPSNLPGPAVKWLKPDSTSNIAVRMYRSDCNYSDTLIRSIQVYFIPRAEIFLTDTLLCKGQSVQITGTIESGANYEWTPTIGVGNPGIANPSITPLTSTLYILKAFSSPFCSTKDSVQFEVKDPPSFELSPFSDTICVGTTILLKSSGSQQSRWLNTRYALSIAEKNLLVKPDSSQLYSLEMFDSTCQITDTLFSQIVVAQKPVIQIEKSNDFNCKVDTVYLKASGGTYYYWLPAQLVSDPRSAQPFVTNRGDRQLFEVTVYSDQGCSASRSIILRDFSYANQSYLVPNAFTPNNDGLNDCFGVAKWGNAVKNFKCEIFNRNGDLIYSSKDVFSCWDGTLRGIPQSSGTYVYMIEAITDCETIKRTGTLVLLR